MAEGSTREGLTRDAYREAGVDIEAGNRAVERMKRHVQSTFRPEVLSGLGGFGALFRLDTARYRKPVLVSGSDGVGTKLMLAQALDRHGTIGIDAVAMCVNDVVVQGAEPLFFLDYLALGKVIPEKVEQIVAGVAEGCRQAGCALIGGETAEMPGMYAPEEYDIAGFAVGVAEADKLVDGRRIRAGDRLIGLASSGLHSNGFSLVRHLLLEKAGFDLRQPLDELDGRELGEVLLTPTRIYVKTVLRLLERHDIKGMAHITGGGFLENIPRILPPGLGAEIWLGAWPVPPVFRLLQQVGQLSPAECYRTFNMGIGLVLAVAPEEAETVLDAARRLGEEAFLIGQVVPGKGVRLVEGNGNRASDGAGNRATEGSADGGAQGIREGNREGNAEGFRESAGVSTSENRESGATEESGETRESGAAGESGGTGDPGAGSPATLPRLAVFASGNGSNFQALADACRSGEIPARIALLVTDRPECTAVERARRLSIPVLALRPKDFPDKASYERQILNRLQEERVDWVVLAGYMRLVGPTLLSAYEGKMINLHPSLLPAFPGKDAIGQAWRHGVKVTGVTVHFVDEGMDTGPIFLQEPVPVEPGDTLESLEERIHRVEHRLLVEAVRRLVSRQAEANG
jgi:phosphoribosylformylglycinamidine cyclo-ligase